MPLRTSNQSGHQRETNRLLKPMDQETKDGDLLFQENKLKLISDRSKLPNKMLEEIKLDMLQETLLMRMLNQFLSEEDTVMKAQLMDHTVPSMNLDKRILMKVNSSLNREDHHIKPPFKKHNLE